MPSEGHRVDYRLREEGPAGDARDTGGGAGEVCLAGEEDEEEEVDCC
jgi:hypothetical protein